MKIGHNKVGHPSILGYITVIMNKVAPDIRPAEYHPVSFFGYPARKKLS